MSQRIRKINNPIVIPRSEHVISRANISQNAIKVLYRLKRAGYQSFLVGGGVRDLLLGREPKDFDVVTNANPEEVKKLFTNCRLIGRRFRLAHINFNREIIEVATFRASQSDNNNQDRHIKNGMIIRDNVFGTIEQDAWRRDFSVNALYYNISDFSVYDYTGGLQDLKKGLLKVIGDPEMRFQEDPVRMLRAIRFAAKLGFKIQIDSDNAIRKLANRIEAVAPARLFDEVLKLFLYGYAVQTYELLRNYGLFASLFPATESSLTIDSLVVPHNFLAQGLRNTDQRIADNKPVNPAFLFAVLLWGPMREKLAQFRKNGKDNYDAILRATQVILVDENVFVTIPKRIQTQVRDIWMLQYRLEHRHGKRPMYTSMHQRFRAAYDFLLLRAQGGESELQELADWWTDFQEKSELGKYKMLRSSGFIKKRNRKKIQKDKGDEAESSALIR